jgi:TPR repeat protein
MFWEPRRAAFCAEYHSDGHLDAKLAAAVPNEASAAALRDDAQNATLCGDYATRARIIRALAERGEAGAQRILDAMYFYGGTHVSQDSILQDKSEGAKWFRRAADQGDDEAQEQLSSIYLNGDGVPQNYIEALKWLTLQAQALIQKLPAEGPWPIVDRVNWLKMLTMAFQITYGHEPSIEIKKEAAN